MSRLWMVGIRSLLTGSYSSLNNTPHIHRLTNRRSTENHPGRRRRNQKRIPQRTRTKPKVQGQALQNRRRLIILARSRLNHKPDRLRRYAILSSTLYRYSRSLSQAHEVPMPPTPLQTSLPSLSIHDWSRTPRAQTRQDLSALSRPGSSLASKSCLEAPTCLN